MKAQIAKENALTKQVMCDVSHTHFDDMQARADAARTDADVAQITANNPDSVIASIQTLRGKRSHPMVQSKHLTPGALRALANTK